MTVAPPERRPPAGEADRDYARRFALEHAHYEEDLPFWRALAAAAPGPVLDAGAATGRVALDLARHGHEVWAVDASPAMVAEMEARLAGESAGVAGRVHPAVGRLESLALGRTFGLVLVAMNTMQVLVTPESREAAFAALASHLAPGGVLAFDVAACSPREVEEVLGEEVPCAVHETSDGTVVRQSDWYEGFDTATMTARFVIRVRDERPGAPPEERLRRHTVHIYTPGEVRRLAEGAGLRVREVHGDFEGGAPGPDSERQVWILEGARP